MSGIKDKCNMQFDYNDFLIFFFFRNSIYVESKYKVILEMLSIKRLFNQLLESHEN